MSGHTPPKGVQKVGQRAVRWIEDGKAGRNFTDVGRHRAHQLANGESLSDAEVTKMKAYFARHEVDKGREGVQARHRGLPVPGAGRLGRLGRRRGQALGGAAGRVSGS